MYNSGNSSKNVTGASIVDGTVETVDIADDAVTADKLANSVNTDIGTGVTASTTAGDALPKAGGAMTGAITTNSTFDGVDVATRDAVLTSTTNTADAALPKAGGTMTGTLAGFTSTGIDDNATSIKATLSDSNLALTTGYVQLSSTDAGDTAGPTVDLHRDSASPAAEDVIGQVVFSGEDSNGAKNTYASIQGQINQASNGAEDGRLLFNTQINSVSATRLELDEAGNANFSGAVNSTSSNTVTSTNANSTSSILKQTSPAFTSGSQTKYGLRINSGNDDFDFGHFTDSGGSAGTIIDTSGTNIGIIIRSDTNGVRLANTATSWSSYSDSRLKNVSGDIDASIDKIKAMRGVYYTLKDDASPTPTNRVGVIAQEVQAVLPEAVDDDSDFMQVRYTDIIPVLIEAVKEQQATIDALTARIVTLETA